MFENALAQYECHSREGGHGWEKARLRRVLACGRHARLPARAASRTLLAALHAEAAALMPSKIAALLPFKTEEAVRQHFLTLEVRQAVARMLARCARWLTRLVRRATCTA